ncbi:MAG: SCP2 sterol-binding domain-containing protein [Methylococcaceae bacterium]|nr:SCP2 sterol-binding domain-containing protein [Methylococcaceae bacterium]MCI0667284.1 SCP2 sterol-binding domain-containing protein [Methylococcaceae bacterium]
MLARAIFLSMLESAVSRYIALDPDATRLLQPISGKVIAIRITGPDWIFYLCPSDNSLQLLEHYEGRPDTTLSGSPFAFASLGLSDNPSSVVFTGKVTIEGDVSVGRNFQMLFKRLDIDWEEQLSHVTGDIAAHQIGNLVRGTLQWGQESFRAMKLNITEYLQEERRDLPTSYECSELFHDVDSIRADTDRLEMRIKRLGNQVPEVR